MAEQDGDVALRVSMGAPRDWTCPICFDMLYKCVLHAWLVPAHAAGRDRCCSYASHCSACMGGDAVETGNPPSFAPTPRRPCSNVCGHVFCFWCMHHAHNPFQPSSCPLCRSAYQHFPNVCGRLHRMLEAAFPQEYGAREAETKGECITAPPPGRQMHAATALPRRTPGSLAAAAPQPSSQLTPRLLLPDPSLSVRLQRRSNARALSRLTCRRRRHPCQAQAPAPARRRPVSMRPARSR